MDQAKRITYPDDHDKVVLPWKLFSVIGGTGTGGYVYMLSNHGESRMTGIRLIAIMLTKLRMSVEEAIAELGIIIESVYTNKLEPAEKTKKLRGCMERLLTKRNLRVDLELRLSNERVWTESIGSLGYTFLFPSPRYLVVNKPTDIF
jgi:hypothetical protein